MPILNYWGIGIRAVVYFQPLISNKTWFVDGGSSEDSSICKRCDLLIYNHPVSTWVKEVCDFYFFFFGFGSGCPSHHHTTVHLAHRCAFLRLAHHLVSTTEEPPISAPSKRNDRTAICEVNLWGCPAFPTPTSSHPIGFKNPSTSLQTRVIIWDLIPSTLPKLYNN